MVYPSRAVPRAPSAPFVGPHAAVAMEPKLTEPRIAEPKLEGRRPQGNGWGRGLRRPASPFWAVLSCVLACTPQTSSDGEGGSPSQTGDFLDGDRSGPLPQKLSELGLFAEGARGKRLHKTARRYEPRFALWSNGSDKERFISLPRGEVVDTSGEIFRFPEGTVFVKTFSFEDEVPVETRVSVLTSEGAKFYSYAWDEDGLDASLLDGRRAVKVAASYGGHEFQHEIPSNLQCRACHESARSPALGFDALRLSQPLVGHETPQLAELGQDIFSTVPRAPDLPSDSTDDVLTLQVLEYFEGNCVHCHNGSDGPSSAFDLRHAVALRNVVGVETTSELLHGLRVMPGEPNESALFRALTADQTSEDNQAMPPLGVQLKDETAIALIEEWISSLPQAD